MSRYSTVPASQALRQANLHCVQCNSQIGIFENEWIRLTSSFARAKHKGLHFGTDVGQKTQVVPSGVVQRAAEGCEMSDVFCQKCSAVVGRFCRTAPNKESQHLLNHYFYKLSRIYLRDVENGQQVEAAFGYGGDVSLSQPQSSGPARAASSAVQLHGPRLSHAPTLVKGHAVQDTTQRQNGDRRNIYQEDTMTPSTLDMRMDNIILGRLAELERRMRGQEHPGLSEMARSNTALWPEPVQNNSSLSINGTSIIEELKTIVVQQQAQIGKVLNMVEALKSTTETLQISMNEMRVEVKSEVQHLKRFKLHGNTSSSGDETKDSRIAELEEENRTLKARFSNIASALQLPKFQSSPAPSEKSRPLNLDFDHTNILGKRKRNEEHLKLANPRLNQNRELLESVATQEQIPTPQTSGSSHSTREPSPAEMSSKEISNGSRASLQSMESSERLENQEAPPQASKTCNETADKITEQSEQPPSNNYQVFGDPTNADEAQDEAQDEPVIIGDPIDFSDDENMLINEELGTSVDVVMINDSDASSIMEQPAPIDSDSDNHHQPPISKASTRGGVKTRKTTRRVTEPVVNHNARSMAPSIGPSTTTERKPRSLTAKRKSTGGIENVTIVTPADVRQRLESKGKPKQPKDRVQTTEKLLNMELEELGLTEWIGKDKRTPEYRAAIHAARARNREAKKLSALASRGVGQKTVDHDNVAPGAFSFTALPHAPSRGPEILPSNAAAIRPPLIDAPNTQGKPIEVVVSEELSSSSEGVLTRRQQRAEEIRKRDQLVKEAMEKEEML